MADIRLLAGFLLATLFFQIYGCSNSESNQEKTVFKKEPELAEIKPEKPVKIKLKRNAGGNYSWELSGSDVERVIQADRKLRDSIKQ
jgi:hypothetical protein